MVPHLGARQFWVGQSGGIDAGELEELYATLDDVEMKEQVIFVASQRNEPEVVDFLMEVACDEEDKELRERALFWLGQSKDPRMAECLLSLIRGRGVNRLYGPRPRGSSGLDLLWRRWPLRLVRTANSPGASPYKSVAKKDKHLFRRLAFTVVGRYLPWVS